ncbi:leucyl/phenylalanyl-tRNA--protein transferase [Candidatus Parabeggiatoa sp. HSG14]|uniref:leucyl/phenylalanyl-tRNA--protein transferase n=1 Tax=Candidatus Parabeggiatoa sp. HSG14 TaxID=3055593 RepID=UPI0025A6A84D|nr:leucyl/phenylalanyl-tRNA--protein transferase [Thiotrichales bacterium HSG14]
MRRPYWIPHNASPDDFPPLEQALEHPDGLLAVGGDLTPSRIIMAYRLGIFPWYSDDEPILWWTPSQRMVLFPEYLKVSRSLRKSIRKGKFTVTLDQNFREVIKECAGFRRHQDGTWITDDMREAYSKLHDDGIAHSVESWYEGHLVGGLYGIALGKVFFGESMFSRQTDASKVAFAHFVWQLQRWGYELVDCQVQSQHLESLGAVCIPRQEYRTLLDHLCETQGHNNKWQFDNSEIVL